METPHTFWAICSSFPHPMLKIIFLVYSANFPCSRLYLLPTVPSLCSLAPTHEQICQRYEPGIFNGEIILMNPNSKSQAETGSRYQKYFLNKCNYLLSQWMPTNSQLLHSNLLMAATRPVSAPGQHHSPTINLAGVVVGSIEQSDFFKVNTSWH